MNNLSFDPDDEFIWNERFPNAKSVESLGSIGDCIVAKYPKFYIKIYEIDEGLFTVELWIYGQDKLIQSNDLNVSELISFGRRCLKNDAVSKVSQLLHEVAASDDTDLYCNC